MSTLRVDDLLRKHNAESCIGCGKCTYSCPVAHRYDGFSPRQVMEELTAHGRLENDVGFWGCVTCGSCSKNCTSGVDFQDLVREVRADMRASFPPVQTHHGVLELTRNLSSMGSVRPRTHNWVIPDLKVDERSETLLFVGCVPYFDVVFKHFRGDLLDIPRAAVRLLNAMDIRPKLLESERCCGHDAYWLGDGATFDRLARANVKSIEASGVEEVIAFCPECYTTLGDLYPRRLGRLPFKVRSLTAILGEQVADGGVKIHGTGKVLTYQDPCRLSKHSDIMREPREVIRHMGELRDMPRSGTESACCGTACWVNCDHTAKRLQLNRLEEAGETGSDTLVTACPKCLVHLSCAQKHHGPELRSKVDIQDIHVLASSSLGKDQRQ